MNNKIKTINKNIFILSLIQITLTPLFAVEPSEFNDKPLSFSKLNSFIPPVIKKYDSWKGIESPSENVEDNIARFAMEVKPRYRNENVVKPQSKLLKKIFGEEARHNSFQEFSEKFFQKIIPSSETKEINQNESFNFFSQLNALQLSLPRFFFLHEGEIARNLGQNITSEKLDTSLSKEGLISFMEFYGQARKIVGKVYESNEDFEKELDHLAKLADEKPVALLLQLDQSKRHSSGLVLKKDEEGNLIAYIFDTMGLDLPAQPCGYRYDGSQNKGLLKVIDILKNKEISFLITPINLRISLQKDLYSCLLVTILFFEAIIKNEIITISGYDYTAVYGGICDKFKKVPLYAINHLPLLTGIQSELALLLMIDCLDESLFFKLAKAKANWIRGVSEEKVEKINYESVSEMVTKRRNIFWQAGYLSLLAWFDSCYRNNKALEFPDFEALALSGDENRDLSNLELLIEELYKKQENLNINESFCPLAEATELSTNVDEHDLSPLVKAQSPLHQEEPRTLPFWNMNWLNCCWRPNFY